MDRRTCFKQMILGGGGILIAPHLLVSCNDSSNVSLEGEYTMQPFASIEQMRNASLLCKGHLSEEMKRVIAGKNLEQIYNFVNQRFATIPSSKDSITNASYNIRWGTRGLLRCGKGTLREKSDLLFYMLTQAGYKPKYFRTNIPLTSEAIDKAFCVKKLDNNEFSAPKKYVNQWEKAFKENNVEEFLVDIPNKEEKKTALTKQIQSFLPEDAHDSIKHYDWLGTDGIEVPVVRIKDGETVRDINLLEGKKYEELLQTKDSYSLYDLDYNTPNKNNKTIRVILRATYSDNLNKPLELVRGEWDLETLIGRQLAIQFVPTISTKQQLQSTIRDLNQFVPFLTLRDLEMSDEERKQHSFRGVGFDMFGNTFEKDGDGILRMNGFKMNTVDESALSKVTSLKAKLIDVNYPNISLKVAPLDDEGNVVLGLGASAFLIKDQDKQTQGLLTKNYVSREVLLLFDSTMSMPYPYSALTFPEELKSKIQTSLEEQFYGQVKLDEKSFGTGEFIKILKTVANQYDYIICFGDGDEFENVTPEILKETVQDTSITYNCVKSNLVIDDSPKKVKQCFKEANLGFYDIENLEQSLQSIRQDLESKLQYPYALTYIAPEENDNLIHKVEVGVRNKNNVATVPLKYTYNRERTYEDNSFPIGLSLEIQWEEGYQNINQHLVGFDIRKDANTNESFELFKQDVKSYVLGTHYLCFEADKPTFPALLNDVLTASLSEAPLALNEDDTLDDLIQKLEKTQPLPIETLATFSGIEDDVGKYRVTFENNFQTCLYSEYYDINKESTVRKIDMLPTSDIRTFALTKKEAFYKTLEETAHLALSEANFFTNSTYSDLKNKSLKRYTSDKKHPLFPILEYTKTSKYHLLIDSSFSSSSYWQINKDTGALLGILPDGSGGGSIIKKERLDLALKIWEAWTNQLIKVTKGGMAMGIVALYGMFLAELYRLVALEINNLGADTDFEEDLKKLLKKYVKKGYKKIKKGLKTKK